MRSLTSRSSTGSISDVLQAKVGGCRISLEVPERRRPSADAVRDIHDAVRAAIEDAFEDYSLGSVSCCVLSSRRCAKRRKADAMGTQQAVPYLDRLQRIVAVGRLKWIEGAKHGAMDDAVWLLFDRPRPLRKRSDPVLWPPRHPRRIHNSSARRRRVAAGLGAVKRAGAGDLPIRTYQFDQD